MKSEPIEVLTYGDPRNPGVVCFHGIPGNGQEFAPLGNLLAARDFYVVTPIRHLHKPLEGLGRLTELNNQVADLIENLPGKKALLAGYSLGCWFALQFAAAHPDLVSGLVLTAPKIFINPETDQVSGLAKLLALPILGPILTPAALGLFRRSLAGFLDKVYFPRVLTPEDRKPILKRLLKIRVLANFFRDKNLFCQVPLNLAPLEPMQSKITVLGCGLDRVNSSVSEAKRLKEWHSGVNLLIEPDQGHGILFTRPDLVVRAFDRSAERENRPQE